MPNPLSAAKREQASRHSAGGRTLPRPLEETLGSTVVTQPPIQFALKRSKDQALPIKQVALMARNLPADAGDIRDAVRSLGQEDPLEEGMATHSRVLVWRIPWMGEPGGLLSMGSHKVRQN